MLRARGLPEQHVDAIVRVRRRRLPAGHARPVSVLTDTPGPMLLVAGTP